MPLLVCLLSLAASLSLSSCAEQPPPTPIAVQKIVSGCKVFGRLSWDVDDTQTTATEVMKYNAAYRRLCRAAK